MNLFYVLLLRVGSVAGLLAGLSSCTAYVPMLGAAPEVRHQGELEVNGSWSLTNRVDFAATYSPAPHVLLHAATSLKGGGRSGSDNSTFVQNNQYELAVGTYWPLGQQWLVGGLAGLGQAHAQARYDNDGGINFEVIGSTQSIPHQLDVIYAKYSAQGYLTWRPDPALSLGLAYRLVQLRLTDATDLGVPFRPGPIWRGEPMLYVRARPGYDQGLLQFQLALGASTTLGYNEQTAGDRLDPSRQFKLARSYVSLGISIFPHLLWRRE